MHTCCALKEVREDKMATTMTTTTKISTISLREAERPPRVGGGQFKTNKAMTDHKNIFCLYQDESLVIPSGDK